MDIKQLDDATKGPCLDQLVATEIMGNRVVEDEIFGLMEMHTSKKGANVYYPLRNYSADMKSAHLVVAKMIRMTFQDEAAYWRGEERPDVICKAALRAVFQRRQKENALKTRASLRVIK